MNRMSVICRVAAAGAGAALLSCAAAAPLGAAALARTPTARRSPAALASITTTKRSSVALASTATAPRSATPARYVPGEVVVGYTAPPTHALRQALAARAGAHVEATAAPDVEVLRLPLGESVSAAAARLRVLPDVAYAVPDFIAHAAGGWIPNDRGRRGYAGAWQFLQWNFLPGVGVDAPDAWATLRRDGAPGGRGVVVAMVDTGVAYRNWVDPRYREAFRESPDFVGTRFVSPCDLVRGTIVGLRSGQIAPTSRCTDPYALDREGHGTFVTGVVAEATNNGIGLTGLAYGASIMPVRVLDAQGNGDAVTIARGIRYAAAHGARVINLSLEFDLSIGAQDIPDVISAISYAHRRGAIVVAAAGNDSAGELAYPARDPRVISVGATTRDRCMAYYSNAGAGLDLVAPGGDDDANLAGDSNCHPDRNLPDIYQMTFPNRYQPTRFSLPAGWFGTSMAAPHVTAAAALVIASRVLGARPSPTQVLNRLEATATPLGPVRPNPDYGYGLLDAAAATARVSLAARALPRRL